MRLHGQQCADHCHRLLRHRFEEELDPVTLHNSALCHMDTDPGGGFRKLNHLLGLGACDMSAVWVWGVDGSDC